MAKLTRWHPFQDLLDVKDDFDKVVDKIFGEELEIFERKKFPIVDIYEDGENIILKAELPGVKKEDISVNITGDTITISGKKEEEKEVKEKNYYRKERKSGSFTRSFTLPCEIDKENVKATFKNGILEIVLPKVEKEKTKQIEIKVE